MANNLFYVWFGRSDQSFRPILRCAYPPERWKRAAATGLFALPVCGATINQAITSDDLLHAAQQLGLSAKLTRSRPDRLALTPLPALAVMRTDDGSLRVSILAQCDGTRVLLQDPATPRPVIEPLEAFATQWTGQLFLISSRASMAGALAKFDFSWFIPALVKYRRLLGEVLLISFALQLFGLVSPLFFQVIMDKVLMHKGLTTLDVLVTGPAKSSALWAAAARAKAR